MSHKRILLIGTGGTIASEITDSSLGVMESYDMTTEAAVAKLMWILGQTKQQKEVEPFFYTPIANDILWPAE